MSLFYEAPKNFESEGCCYFEGKCKIYNMALEHGCPNIVVESYFGKGVSVYYAPTCQTYNWSWKNRSFAWEFAKARKQHVSYVRSGGKYARNAA